MSRINRTRDALWRNTLKDEPMLTASEAATEKAIQDKGLNAPRLTPASIDAVIVGETFTVMPSGKCLICELTLVNGFTVRGEASAVSKENFNVEIGKDISRKKARDQIWLVEGYLLQQRLHDRADVAAVRGAVARGWCAEMNVNKEMDSDLAEAIVDEVLALNSTR